MRHGEYDDKLLKSVLKSVRRIACVGVSPNPVRPSYFVARYLSMKGYDIVPVNPGQAGARLFGAEVRASLADIPDPETVDMVDIFRRSEAVPAIVDEALERLPNLRVIWMQFGVIHEDAAAKARARGLTVIMDRCPKVEHQRLFGELRKAGFATGIISSKL